MSPTLKRSLKTRSKHLLWSAFEIGQRLKFDLLPRHFYSEIPDIRTLRGSVSWRKPRSFKGFWATSIPNGLGRRMHKELSR